MYFQGITNTSDKNSCAFIRQCFSKTVTYLRHLLTSFRYNLSFRDEIDDIVEGFNKKSDYKWFEFSDTDFLDENNSSSSGTESDKKSTGGTSTTQKPTINSQNNFRWRKKQPFSFGTSFIEEHVTPPPLDPLSPYQYFKFSFDDNLLNTLQDKKICTQLKLAANQ